MTSGARDGLVREWTCDTCGERVSDPARALVVWQVGHAGEDGPSLYREFRIVHKTFRNEPDPRDCDPGNEGGFTHSLELDNFLGADGLTRLLSFLSAGPLIGPGRSRIAPEDLDGYVDLVRRLQVPDYERARPRFGDESTLNWLSDANEIAPYTTDMLGRIADGRLSR
jgi:hypothetical protein